MFYSRHICVFCTLYANLKFALLWIFEFSKSRSRRSLFVGPKFAALSSGQRHLAALLRGGLVGNKGDTQCYKLSQLGCEIPKAHICKWT